MLDEQHVESLTKRIDDVEKRINDALKKVEAILEEIMFIKHRFNTHVEIYNDKISDK